MNSVHQFNLSNTSPEKKYREDIDGLRMLAVLPVVFNHAGFAGFSGGFIGVDIFLVISGFLITRILMREIEEKRFSILNFYERRARRILPALFVVLTVCLVGGWWLMSPQRYEALGKSVIATLVFVSNIWFWRRTGDYFGPNVEFELLLHTWSLAVEEQFYLVFPLLLWVIAPLARWAWTAIVALLVVLSFALSMWMTQTEPTANFYLVPTRAWELGAGSLLALGAFPTSRHRSIHEVAGWVGLLLILGSIFLITSQTPFPGLAALPSVAGATLVIYSGTGNQTSVGRLLSWRPFVWIGLISYSLYLWHWPVFFVVRSLTQDTQLSFFTAIICIAFAIALAWLSWRYVERPFRITSASNAFSQLQIFLMSGAGIVLLGLCGFVIAQKNGIVGQFPQARIPIYQKAIQRDPLYQACMTGKADKPCYVGAPKTTPTIVLWGDSHAGAMAPGFDEWLREVEKSAFVYSIPICLPLLGAHYTNVGPGYGCSQYNASVLANIKATPSIRTVVLAGRWALATEGVRAKHEAGGTMIMAKDGTPAAGITDNPRLVDYGLNRLVKALRDSDINVVMIRGTPEIGFNVPNIVLRYGSYIPDKFRPTRAAIETRNARADKILDSIAERHGALIVSPRDLMCDNRCLLELKEMPLYQDDDHLSGVGARWIVPKIMQSIPFEN